MDGILTFHVDMREFDRAWQQYMDITHRRSIPDIINQKAYYIARRALYETPKTSKQIIVSSLGQIRRSKKQIYTGSLTAGRGGDAPLAALIINAARGKKGIKGLYGEAMKRAIAAFIMGRTKSGAFIASGWLPAVRTMAPFAHGSPGGAPPVDRSVKQLGQPHGSAQPATPGWNSYARIENAADLEAFKVPYHVRTHNPEALIKYGGPALQRAFDKEAESMLEHIAEVQFEAAKEIGIRVARV